MFFHLKDPDAKLDFGLNWDDGWLESSETITASEWIVPSGIVNEGDSFDDTTTTIWLSGGTDGENYNVVNRITTSDARIEDRTLVIKVRSR